MVLRYISLFTGVGGMERGLHKTIPNAKCVGFSEINAAAIKVYQHHYPDHRNLGDIKNLTPKMLKTLGRVDLIIGGFPCRGSSSTGKKLGLRDDHTKLLYNMLDIIRYFQKHQKTKVYYLGENVFSMSGTLRDQINFLFGEVDERKYVEPIYVDVSKVSPQNRKRLIWTNIPGAEEAWKRTKPDPTVFKDIASPLSEIDDRSLAQANDRRLLKEGTKKNQKWFHITEWRKKANNLTQTYNHIVFDPRKGFNDWRRLTIPEMEQMAGFPKDYLGPVKDKRSHARRLMAMSVNPKLISILVKPLRKIKF